MSGSGAMVLYVVQSCLIQFNIGNLQVLLTKGCSRCAVH